jgi:hypothetical protein
MRVIQIRHRSPQWLYASRRTVLASIFRDLNCPRARERSFDPVFDFGGSLAEICPCGGIVEEAVLVGAFGGPYDAGGGAGGVEASVRPVASVGAAELSVDF